MNTARIDEEVSAAKKLSDTLISTDPIVSATGQDEVAHYVAVSERIDKMSAPELAEVLREGLDAAEAEQYRRQLRPIARDILLRALGTI